MSTIITNKKDGINISWATDAKSNINKIDITEAYQEVAAFEYDPDKNEISTSITVTMSASETNPSHSLKLIDITNSKTIAESTNNAIAILHMHDLGTVSNIPTQKAVFMLEVKKDSPTPSLDVQFLSLSGK